MTTTQTRFQLEYAEDETDLTYKYGHIPVYRDVTEDRL